MLAMSVVFALTSAASTTPADPQDKVRCVREDIIGSLIQTRKVCHTLREWEIIRSANNDAARRLVDQGQRVNQPN